MISWETLNATQQLVVALFALSCASVYTPITYSHWRRNNDFQSILLFAVSSHWIVDASHLTWWATYRLTGANWMLHHAIGQMLPSLKIPVAATHLWMARGYIIEFFKSIWANIRNLIEFFRQI